MTTARPMPAGNDRACALHGGSVHMVPFGQISAADRTAWDALGAEAAARGAANVFAQPWVVRAGLQHINTADVTLAFVNRPDGQLIAVIPLIAAQRLGRFPLPHWQIWNHPNSFCAPLLIRTGHEAKVWDLLLPSLAGNRSLCALAITTCPISDGLFATLKERAAAGGLDLAVVEQHDRALADATTHFDRYWDTHVRAKKRKELRRQAARLGELGAVALTQLSLDADAAPWVDEFLDLERLGWKGAAGSALAEAPGTEAFFRKIVLTAHATGCLSFLALRLDGRAIAMLVTLFDGDAAFSFKTAYDEDLARYSPGVQIQQAALTMLAERKVRWADSCAAADHPMIDSIWAQRRTIGTVVVGLPGVRNRALFMAYRAALRGWRALKTLRRTTGKPR